MKKIHTVTLPDIGEGVAEGEVIEWLKNIGDPLTQDEPVVIVMTDKATVELPAPYPGFLSKQYVKVSAIALKGKPLYDIEMEVTEQKEIGQLKEEKKEIAKSIYKPILKEELKKQSEAVLSIPSVRKAAKEFGVEIENVKGSGKEGRVTLEDLKVYIKEIKEKKEQDPILHLPGDEEKPLVGIRSLMAKKMAESNAHIPHFSFFEQVEVTRLVKLKEKYREEASKTGVHVTYMPFILRALSLALKTFPEMNSSFNEAKNSLIIHKPHHIGIAITSAYGLIVPVLKNVDQLKMNDLILAYEDLKKRAETNQLKPIEMKGSTITVTNFGVFGEGVEFATPIINYPEVVILGIARIQKEPVVKNNEVVIQDMLHLSWSFDHRVADGDAAAKFSHHVASLLHNPALLL